MFIPLLWANYQGDRQALSRALTLVSFNISYTRLALDARQLFDQKQTVDYAHSLAYKRETVAARDYSKFNG